VLATIQSRNFYLLVYYLKTLRIRIQMTLILPVALHVCKAWFLTLRGEYRLRVSENRVLRIMGPKKDIVAGMWRECITCILRQYD
jgi:hypothetical protein